MLSNQPRHSPAIHDAAVTRDECRVIKEYIESWRASGINPSMATSKRIELPYFELRTNPKTPAVVREVRSRCLEIVRKDSEQAIYPEFTLFAINYKDDAHLLHSDNSRYDREQQGWVPNHTPHRFYSMILYLNDHGSEYEGGRLHFPQHDLVIAPKAGLLLSFPSDHRYLHEVEPIISGTRVSMVSWFMLDREFEEKD